MKPTQDKYPLFEANQVLTSGHLNEIFDYLNEQDRLTRANLIGIGIECGLEFRNETVGSDRIIYLSKGCGVGSAGYLLIEPDNVKLVSYQAYTLPVEVDYPQFRYESAGKSIQFPLWEMFAEGEPNTILLGKEKDFLDNKAFILFLELKKEGLRNCSPNNCDDKGAEITATVRRLLIGIEDLSKIIANANKLGAGYTATDIESSLLARLNLPDLRLPRYNVPNTAPISSNDVLAGFLAVFQQYRLAGHLGDVLSKTYFTFRPLLSDIYTEDPFAGFTNDFGFLDAVPSTTSQVRFLQYYFDFFDDLIQAYEEFRWKGAELMCACCPSEDLFPRHLMLGLIRPDSVPNSGVYRHDFVSSPAILGCEKHKAEVLQLFARMVEMVKHFTNNPTPPDFTNKEVARKFIPVRVTPSRFSNVPLSVKSIPYYYLQNGNPPLFQLWNVEKSRRNRANQNLSFRSDEYIPAAPEFVNKALQYDLEPYNFFRIEGHLGKNVKSVLSTLLALRTNYDLPIEIIALRTGEFDARMPIDLSREDCRFEDLEAFYDALRDEFISSLVMTLSSFYARKVSREVLLSDGFKPSLIHTFNPDIVVAPSTFGAMLEMHFATMRKSKSTTTSFLKREAAFNIKDAFIGESTIIQATASYAEVLLNICNYLKNRLLSDFSLVDFRDLFDQLVALNTQFKKQPDSGNSEWNELFNLIEAVRYANQMEAFRSIGEEYAKRLIDVKKKMFLSNFLLKNPGIQHKAGVPIGGTFIIVYHDDPTPLRQIAGSAASFSSLKANFSKVGFASQSSETITKAFERLQVKTDIAQVDPDIQLIISEMSKQVVLPDFQRGSRGKTVEKIIAQTVNEFADGTVIADFYLPYICCSDCSPIQYIIPKDPLNFTVSFGCTNPDDRSKVVVTPLGGTAPYKIKINSGDFIDLQADFLLGAGKYALILRDSDGTVSDSQTIEIPTHLSLSEPSFDCVSDQEYITVFQISGGTPPYTASTGKVQNANYISDPLPEKKETQITITDSRNCSTSVSVNHSCGSDLTFTVKFDCTSPKNIANAVIVPVGGVEPYEIQVGKNPFVPLTDIVPLNSGTNSITIRDKSGATVSQDVIIPSSLDLTIAEYVIDYTNNTYQARIQVNGGIAPYNSSTGKQTKDNEFISNPIHGGELIIFEVFDGRKCSSKIEVKHVIDKPCSLPCEGQSRKCAYRLWLQPPAKESATFESYRQLKDLRLRFNGQNLELPSSTDLLQIPFDALNKDFVKVMAQIVGKLNEIIQKVIIEKFGDIGKNRLTITYEPTEGDPFGMLWIEYFICETFNLEFEYMYAKDSKGFNLRWRYTNETDDLGKPFNGTITTDLEMNTQFAVPAFDCRERDQCKGTDYVKLCTESNLKAEFGIKQLDNNVFNVAGSGKNKNVVCLVWDIINTSAKEPFYIGASVDITVPKPTGVIRLTVINDKGCFAIAENNIVK